MFSTKEKTSFQAELNAWIDAEVIDILSHAQPADYGEAVGYVKKRIAEKTRESFINGLKAQKK